MTNHFNGLSEAQAERLAILAEECAEVQQAVCKILRHGYNSKHPKYPNGEDNRQMLERETGDLQHALGRCVEAGDLNPDAIIERQNSKPKHILPYLHHQGGGHA